VRGRGRDRVNIRPRSLKWRAIGILVGTLLLSHLIAILVYSADCSETLATADTLDLTERIAGYVELAADRSGDRRRSVLTAANSRFLSVRFGGPFGQGGCAPFPLAAEVNTTLREGVPDGVEW